jgi:ParE toxin of type II toxin-antitoxin system, parDE
MACRHRQHVVAGAQLLMFPNRGRLGKKEGTRELVMSPLPYIVVYTVRGDAIYIVRILHGIAVESCDATFSTPSAQCGLRHQVAIHVSDNFARRCEQDRRRSVQAGWRAHPEPTEGHGETDHDRNGQRLLHFLVPLVHDDSVQ